MPQAKGFFTDTSVCISCKACEVACKEWNQLAGDEPRFLADSFDNTGRLDAENWRHVKFLEPEARLLSSTTGGDDSVYGGLNSFFLLMDRPEVYGLPTGESARLPSRNNVGSYLGAAITAALAVIGGLIAFRRRRERPGGAPEDEEPRSATGTA